MKERITPQQRLQFIKMFGVPHDIAPTSGQRSLELVEIDSQRGYARLEGLDSRDSADSYTEYQLLDKATGAYAYRQGHRREMWLGLPQTAVTYVDEKFSIRYEPDYFEQKMKIENMRDAISVIKESWVKVTVGEDTEGVDTFLLEGFYYPDQLCLRLNERASDASGFFGPKIIVPRDDPENFVFFAKNRFKEENYDYQLEYGEYSRLPDDERYAYKMEYPDTTYRFSIADLVTDDQVDIFTPCHIDFLQLYRQVTGDAWQDTSRVFPVTLLPTIPPSIKLAS